MSEVCNQFIQQETIGNIFRKHCILDLHDNFSGKSIGTGTKSTHATLEHISWRKPAKTMRGKKHEKNMRTQNTMNIFHMIHYSLEISSLVTWSSHVLPSDRPSDFRPMPPQCPAHSCGGRQPSAGPRQSAGGGDWRRRSRLRLPRLLDGKMALGVKYPAAQA